MAVSELVSQRAFATEAGTARFVRRHGAGKAADAYRTVGHLHLSTLGLGTYLGPTHAAADAAYTAAVVEAVRRGVNVLDTASNYRCQRSERAVGQALQALIATEEIYRSEVLVASKAGFVPFDGAPPADPEAYIRSITVERGLCAPDELVAGCHCMAPAFLQAMLAQSLANLELPTVDVYFVHNPETQLQVLGREAFYDRLKRAFAALEQAADQGHIRVYGLATWTGLRARPDERDHVSLEEVVRCAEEVAGTRHRCKAVQLPLNLGMPEAYVRANQTVRGERVPALEAARRLGLVAFTSGSLLQGRLLRASLPHVPPLPEPMAAALAGLGPAGPALQFARSVPGVTTALVGMGHADHVAANLQVLGQPLMPETWLRAAAQEPSAAAWA